MQWNYVGGLFDGEGCVWYDSSVRVSISNTHKPVLDAVKKFVGYGTVRMDGDSKVWKWEASGINAHHFLKSMLSVCEIKHPQISVALMIRDAHPEQREVLKAALKGLKTVRYEDRQNGSD